MLRNAQRKTNKLLENNSARARIRGVCATQGAVKVDVREHRDFHPYMMNKKWKFDTEDLDKNPTVFGPNSSGQGMYVAGHVAGHMAGRVLCLPLQN